MYESPIELLYSDLKIETLKDEVDQVIVRAVQEIVPSVNKEELIKALQYDRDQYLKGYTDGLTYTPPVKTHYDQVKAMSLEELAEWLGDKDTCPPGECTHMYDGVDCPECWRDWLNTEVPDEQA